MDPFTSHSAQSQLSVDIPLGIQGSGSDIRCLMPKYGFISERKFILREVIRLKEINFSFDDLEYNCSAKSAFLPKSRLQVYFLENERMFGELNNLLFKSKNGRYLPDNDLRFSFYSLASLMMLPNLFWFPDLIICNGWTSSLVPFYLEKLNKHNKNFSKIKTIYLTSSLNEEISLDLSNLFKNSETFSEIKSLNFNELGCLKADATIILNNEKQISSKLMKSKIFKSSSNCSIVNIKNEENDSMLLLDEVEKVIKSLK